MNNNRNNFNINPQSNNMNNSNSFINNQNNMMSNNNQEGTFIKNPNNFNNLNNNLNNELDNRFNNPSTDNFANNLNNNFSNNNFNQNNLNNNFTDEDNPLLSKPQNKFINNEIDTTSTSLNDLNVDGNYHNMPKVDYSQEPKVQENLGRTQKNTVTITSEGKIFLVIIAALLVFIFVMPYIFDLFRNVG